MELETTSDLENKESGASSGGFGDLFDSGESLDTFFNELLGHMLNLWIDNDRLIAIMVSPDYVDSLSEMLKGLDLSSFGEVESSILKNELENISVLPSEHVERFELVCLRDRMRLSQAMFLKHWAAKTGVQEYLTKSGIPYVPTTQELGIAFLMMTAIPESQNSRVLTASSLPSFK